MSKLKGRSSAIAKICSKQVTLPCFLVLPFGERMVVKPSNSLNLVNCHTALFHLPLKPGKFSYLLYMYYHIYLHPLIFLIRSCS